MQVEVSRKQDLDTRAINLNLKQLVPVMQDQDHAATTSYDFQPPQL